MITDDDIRLTVGERAFEAGLQYHLDGRVHGLRFSRERTAVDAMVLGSAKRPYHQSIRLNRRPNGTTQASGTCSCPVALNCKHVAAVLLECQEQELSAVAELKSAAASRRSPDPGAGSTPHLPNGPAASSPQAVEAEVPHDVANWLRGLDDAQQEDSEDYPPSVRKRLLYVLSLAPHTDGPTMALHSIELRRDGTMLPGTTRHDPEQLLRGGQQPKFLRPSDRMVLRQLASSGRTGADGSFVATLKAIIATGRGRWAAPNGPVLTEGEPVGGHIEWQLHDDGGQKPRLVLPSTLMPLGMAEPWYVDPATGVAGPIETALSPRLLRALLCSPVVPPALVPRVRAELERRWPHAGFPAPRPVVPPRPLREAMRPHLLLLSAELPFDPARMPGDGRYRHPQPAEPRPVSLARLSWCYDPVTLPSSDPFQPAQLIQRDGALFQVIRDRRAEMDAATAAGACGFAPLSRFHVLPHGHPHARDLLLADPEATAWLDFMLEDVPRLREEGWTVELDDSFPLRLVQPDGDVEVTVIERAGSQGSGIDWFDVDLGVMVDGERISLVPALLDLIATTGLEAIAATDDDDGAANGDGQSEQLPLILPLLDGRLITLPLSRLRPVLIPLLELFAGADVDEAAGALRLSRRNAGDLAALEEASAAVGLIWNGGDAIRALGRQLREHAGLPPISVPSDFTAVLRPYQQQGLNWLQFLRGAELGGVLADDMGLGKTVQTLAHLAVERAQGRAILPSLAICPTSLVANWQAEAARFAPALRCLVLHGPDRAERFGAIGDHDLVVSTYPLLARDHAVLAAQDWHLVVLDEAQTIKNPQATISRLARTLRARQRLCLSGTPLENHLGELWSLFDFLLPGFLGDRRQFGARFRGPIEKRGDTERQAVLARRIAPFLLRRTKEEVAPELPAKTEITETVELGQAQRAVYEGIRLAMHAKVRAAIAKRGLAGSGIVILDALLKLRQACCDPRLLKLPAAKAAKAGSAKLHRLLELLPPMLEEGRRVLLFSQFTSMLALIEAELTRLGISYALLTGDTRDRAGPVRHFQSGEVPLFLISLKAGGVGLNLTAADTVIHYDPWWNPAVENQATDRAHRIGQDKPVFVHRLITASTVEEKMQVLKERKRSLTEGILQAGTAHASHLTQDDLDVLFS